MGPKPFPYPIGVGVDICQFTRLYRTLAHDSEKVTRWARKVFARREWPILHQKFYRASDNQTRFDSFPASLWLPQVKPIRQLDKGTAMPHTETTYSFRRPKPGQDEATVEHDASDPMAALDAGLVTGAQSVAKVCGRPVRVHVFMLQVMKELKRTYRWAAKEAAIKAHRHRDLRMSDISILCPDLPQPEHLQGSTRTVKLQALIPPEPTLRILMVPEVAQKRGLRGGHSKFTHIYGEVVDGRFVQDSLPKGDAAPRNTTASKFIVKRARIKDEEQQIAEISISHDGDYSVAVCMALDEPSTKKDAVEYIVDDGVGEPLHEPEWGDKGWLDTDESSSED
ncbi:MAG: hypothetical protein Q9208_002292 [Pyrenodesmia sp. 3 TL-2023]